MPVRACLEDIAKDGPPHGGHAGLWLDRFVVGNNAEERKPSLQKATRLNVPEGYVAWLKRWERSMWDTPDTRVYRLKTDHCRLVCGIGGASTWENGITLHHTWGVPMIPGSSLKGLAASFATTRVENDAWRRTDGESHRFLFGTTEQGGAVVFHDALYLAESENASVGLDVDTMTPHHSAYYGSGNEPPTEFDSPVPIPYLTARGSFSFALTGPEPWREAVFRILEKALLEEGIGAKTSSGYGRMCITRLESPREKNLNDVRTAIQDAYRRPANGLPNRERDLLTVISKLAEDDWPEMLRTLNECITEVGRTTKRTANAIRNRLHQAILNPGDLDPEFVGQIPQHVEGIEPAAEAHGLDPTWSVESVIEEAPDAHERLGDWLRGRLKAQPPAAGSRIEWSEIRDRLMAGKYKTADKSAKKKIRRTIEKLLGSKA